LPTRNGLDQLNVSASGQLSEHDIQSIKDSLTSGNKLIIIDLRWERHGFLNGEPISWNKDGRVNTGVWTKMLCFLCSTAFLFFSLTVIVLNNIKISVENSLVI